MNVETLRAIPGIVVIVVVLVLFALVVRPLTRSIFANDELSEELDKADRELREQGR